MSLVPLGYDLDAEQFGAAETIMETLMALPWEKRTSVWNAVMFNNMFCVHCGYGSREHPNGNCQCTNDE
jgi:hypothetical protein